MTVSSRAVYISGVLVNCRKATQKRGNYKVKAWPALVDERDSVAIKLFDNPLEQKQAMWNGLRRLLLLNIPSPIIVLARKAAKQSQAGAVL